MLYIHQILTSPLHCCLCVMTGGSPAGRGRWCRGSSPESSAAPAATPARSDPAWTRYRDYRYIYRYILHYIQHTAEVSGTFCFWIHLWEQSCGPVLDTWHRNIWCWQWSAETPSSCTCTQEGVGSVSSTKMEPLPTFFYYRTFNLHSKLDEHPEYVTKCFWSGLKY